MWVGRLWVPKLPTFNNDAEECGLILGVQRKGWLYGREALLVRNDADNPYEHFRMHVPLGLLRDTVAIFHTHPAPEAVLAPSDHDRAVSTQAGLCGLVIAPDGRLRTYRGRYTSRTVQPIRKRLRA